MLFPSDSLIGVTSAASLPFRAQVGSELLVFSSSTPRYLPSAHFERLVHEGSLSNAEIHTLASTLPTQVETATLLDIFFRDINPLFFPFDETWFREHLNSDILWGPFDLTCRQDGPNHLSALTLLFAILSLTFLCLPRALGSPADGTARAARMALQCQRCHMLANSIQCHDAFIVLSYMLLGRCAVILGQGKEGWLLSGSALRQAQLIGLHRLGHVGSTAPLEDRDLAMRRVIWLHLCFGDTYFSLIMGQMPVFDESFCNTGPPSRICMADPNLSDFDLAGILRIRYDLTRIGSRIARFLLSREQNLDHEAICQLDDELQGFLRSLPDPYKTGNSCAALQASICEQDDVSLRNVALHRFVLHNTIYFMVISLHLPNLRQGRSHLGFERSREAAIQAAVNDYEARQELRTCVSWPDTGARDNFVGGRFSYFHATSTLGICLLSEPDPARVKQLSPLLDIFLQSVTDLQRQGGLDPDRCIRQEIGVVSLLRDRLSRISGLGGPHRHLRVQRQASSNQSSAASAGTPSSADTEALLRMQTNDTTAIELQEKSYLECEAPLVPAADDPAQQSCPTQTAAPPLPSQNSDWWSWVYDHVDHPDLHYVLPTSTQTDQ